MKPSFLLNRRKEIGLSQIEIAEKLGYSPQMVSLWESGKSSPSILVWSQYASLLQIDLESFVYDKAKKKNNLCEEQKFNAEAFAKNLKRLRLNSGLTQIELAKKLSINNKTVSSWEQGNPSLDVGQFIELMNLYNLSCDDLYFAISSNVVVPSKKKRILTIVLPIVLVTVISSTAVTTTLVITNRKNNQNIPIDNQYQSDETSHWKLDDQGNPIEVTPHSFDSYISKNATCLEDGETTSECVICGYIKKTSIPATGHTPDEGGWHYNEDYHYHICAHDQVTFDKTLHVFDDGQLQNDNTVIYRCTVCPFSKTVPLDDYIISKEKMYFGMYPQSRVTDSTLLTALNGLTEKESNGYYLYNDSYYHKKTAKLFYGSNHSWEKFNDGALIEDGKEYWFNVEPISWRILEKTDDDYFLFADMILDIAQYSASLKNNYKDSSIRSWLNNEFFNNAFFANSSKVLEVEVDNSLSSTGQDINAYVCDNTLDKVFLPSVKEMKNKQYDLFSIDDRPYGYLTDYARINEAWIYPEFISSYCLRSPNNSNDGSVHIINTYGQVSITDLYSDIFQGVRPMIKVIKE